MRYIDLRSDTVTQPTQEMRDAMQNALVGDDVYQDDPTTNELEAYAAKVLGKEAALFVTSGTMGNQLGIMAQTRRGDEIIAGSHSHIVVHEVGAAAVLSGVTVRMIDFPAYMPIPEMIENAIRSDDIHEPPTSMICLENALANGRVVPLETMAKVRIIADKNKLPIHLDGARVFNAAAFLGVDVKEITKYCDTISCCLSKGLCAPVGAILAGSEEVVSRARKFRKMIGGGMRQNGILAAAGIIALRDMQMRLVEDHENAKYTADRLSKISGVNVMWDCLDINMVFFTIDRSAEIVSALEGEMLKRGIKIGGYSEGAMRWVLNNDINREDIDTAVSVLKDLLG